MGTVAAPDAHAAIAKAIEEFRVEPARQGRLIAVEASALTRVRRAELDDDAVNAIMIDALKPLTNRW
jgi:hypothetical protein